MQGEFTSKEIKNMAYKKHRPFFDEIKSEWFKFCTPCGQTKPLAEFKVTTKRVLCCKNCYNQKKRQAHNRKPLEVRREIASKKMKARTPEQIEAMKTYDRNWRAKPENKKRILEGQRRRYKPWTKTQYEKYYEKMQKGVLAYQARKKNAPVVIHFTKKEIISRDGLNCYLCEKTLTERTATIDHVIPLSRGGSHKPENAKIACKHCNSSKHNKTLAEYKKFRGDYERFRNPAISSKVYL